jgi:hypothetical protein
MGNILVATKTLNLSDLQKMAKLHHNFTATLIGPNISIWFLECYCWDKDPSIELEDIAENFVHWQVHVYSKHSTTLDLE